MKGMYHLTVTLVLLWMCNPIEAQYYYSDIIANKQTNQQFALLKKQKIKEVSAISYESNNLPSPDFSLTQTINPSYTTVFTRTLSATLKSALIATYENDKLIKSADSSSGAINITTYEYDSSGKLVTVASTSNDEDGSFSVAEKHLWHYNNKGEPQQMLKIKNETDTLVVEIIVDSTGKVIEEKWRKNNRTSEVYYYYYDVTNRLTDIVRYNRKAKALLPDFLFEYDEKGLIRQMVQVQNGTTGHLTWKYQYAANGLKQREYCYNKNKQLLGKFEYRYVRFIPE
jgi:antitoxin component YwqK of YwqJK toxin-antitoxin module